MHLLLLFIRTLWAGALVIPHWIEQGAADESPQDTAQSTAVCNGMEFAVSRQATRTAPMRLPEQIATLIHTDALRFRIGTSDYTIEPLGAVIQSKAGRARCLGTFRRILLYHGRPLFEYTNGDRNVGGAQYNTYVQFKPAETSTITRSFMNKIGELSFVVGTPLLYAHPTDTLIVARKIATDGKKRLAELFVTEPAEPKPQPAVWTHCWTLADIANLEDAGSDKNEKTEDRVHMPDSMNNERQGASLHASSGVDDAEPAL